MQYLYKSGFCRWCGGRTGACPVTDEMRRALKKWAGFAGRRWKSQLIAFWDYPGGMAPPELREARAVLGPAGLRRITPGMLARVSGESEAPCASAV